ncbi:MAG: flagellar biosynthesis repressor FlbT [Syntrophus sp. PtaB.Bin001]|jgi:flagellar protein FlbT|nr:MAG: flagellar biosynthesis repressor FlbT [Syntrophus sp. PtaB.Bin001]
MALKIGLKPNEKLIINGAVIQNGKNRSEFIIENCATILREKDILRADEATTYCSKIYLAIQMMYIDEQNLVDYHNTYWTLVRDLVKAVPSTVDHAGAISEHLLKNEYYQALKAARKLMDYEQEVLNRVRITT